MMKILEDLLLNTTTSSKVEAINLLNLLLLLNQAILSLSKTTIKIRIIRTVRTEVIRYNIPSLKNNSLLRLNNKDNSKLKHRLSTNFDMGLLRTIEKKETLSMQKSCITVIQTDLTTTLFLSM
nr:MAG TPA: hypothetical protein [Caudoviricetes sp.]